MKKPTKTKYRKKAKVSLVGKKLSDIDPIIAERLKKLHEDLFAVNINDIRKGKVHDETLRAMCNMISHKMKEHPEFQNTPGLYVAESLDKICDKVDAEKAFRLGNLTADIKANNFNLKIALAIWEEMNFSKKKSSTIFSEAAEKFNTTATNTRKIFYDHKKEIDNLYKSTEKCSL